LGVSQVVGRKLLRHLSDRLYHPDVGLRRILLRGMPRAAGEVNSSGVVINCRPEAQKALPQDARYSHTTLCVKLSSQ
jgi:hypothetical protein